MLQKAMRWRMICQILALFLFGNLVEGAKANELATVGSPQWVKKKMDEYPELSWLLDEKVEHTQEGGASQKGESWSRALKGSHYPEFERTIATLVNFHLLLDGSDEAFKRFVESQPSQEALTRENFQKLHTFVQEVLAAQDEGSKAVEVDLILGDMGKTPEARRRAAEYSVDERDHDIFLSICLKKCPEIFPTFSSISKKLQQALKEGTGLIHFGHAVHLEGDLKMLDELKNSNIVANNPKAFDLQILAYMMDVSGARAHEDNRGAKSFTNNIFLAINGMKEALSKLATQTPKEALSYYVDFRANLLGLDPSKQENRVLARLGAMMRLFTPEDGQILEESYHLLADDQKKAVERTFNPFTARKERTPTYIPAVFVNFLDSAMKQSMQRQEAINKCLIESVVPMAVFLQTYREGKANQPYKSHMTLNFNKTAGQVRNDINVFKNHNFFIDKDWNVTLIVRP